MNVLNQSAADRQAEVQAEREALHELVTSPGWAALKAYHALQWGAQTYASRIERACTAIPASHEAGKLAAESVREITAAKQTADLLIGWPEARLKELGSLQPAVTAGSVPWARATPVGEGIARR